MDKAKNPAMPEGQIALEELFKCIIFSRPEKRRHETLLWLQRTILDMPKSRSALAAYNAYEKVRDFTCALKGQGYRYEHGVGVVRSSCHGHQRN